jgi:hypothetical protein
MKMVSQAKKRTPMPEKEEDSASAAKRVKASIDEELK